MTKKPNSCPTPKRSKKDKHSKEPKEEKKDERKKDLKLHKTIPVNSAIETSTHCYSILSKLGAGGFGDVYEVVRKSDKLVCAVKVEFVKNSPDRRLKKEYEIYREITKAKLRGAPNSKHLMEVIDYGECKGVAHFMFMPLCGQSLDSVLKKKSPSLETAINLADQTLQAVQNFHSFMHIHRDLKPANFVLGKPPDDQRVFLIDFGMAVKFCIDPKKMPRTSVYDFIGTMRYASRTTHQGMPQTRKDDIESWFYVTLEFFSPKILPWSGEKNSKAVNTLKEEFFVEEPKEVFSKLPPSFVQIAALINETKPIEQPDYDAIHKALMEVAINHGLWINGPLEFSSPELEEYVLY